YPLLDFVAFDATYQRYVRANSSGDLIIRQVKDDHQLMHLPGFGRRVSSFLRFSPNGQLLVVHYSAQNELPAQVWIWSLDRQEAVLNLPCASGDIPDCDFSPDGLQIAFCQSKGPVLIYDSASGKAVNSIRQDAGSSAIRYQPGGGKI